MSKPQTLEIKKSTEIDRAKTDITIQLSLSIVDCRCTARFNLINHFQRTRHITPLTEKHYSVDRELLFHSRKWQRSIKNWLFSTTSLNRKISLTLAFSSRPREIKIIPVRGRLPFNFKATKNYLLFSFSFTFAQQLKLIYLKLVQIWNSHWQ